MPRTAVTAVVACPGVMMFDPAALQIEVICYIEHNIITDGGDAPPPPMLLRGSTRGNNAPWYSSVVTSSVWFSYLGNLLLLLLLPGYCCPFQSILRMHVSMMSVT
jgi:hypothetical protein